MFELEFVSNLSNTHTRFEWLMNVWIYSSHFFFLFVHIIVRSRYVMALRAPVHSLRKFTYNCLTKKNTILQFTFFVYIPQYIHVVIFQVYPRYSVRDFNHFWPKIFKLFFMLMNFFYFKSYDWHRPFRRRPQSPEPRFVHRSIAYLLSYII